MTPTRVVIAIPAYNEAPTLREVLGRVRQSLPEHDLVVVNDGSRDGTTAILEELGVPSAHHLCNLGYGRAIQTALQFALRHDYDVLVTLDADGQHDPGDVRGLLDAMSQRQWDVGLGSRYVRERSHRGAPLGRQLGMRLFSMLVRCVSGTRIWDTTTGLRAIARPAFEPLSRWHFVDFHAEALVYLMRLGFRIGEHPVTVAERRCGESMYSLASSFKYVPKTSLMMLLGLTQAMLVRRGISG